MPDTQHPIPDTRPPIPVTQKKVAAWRLPQHHAAGSHLL